MTVSCARQYKPVARQVSRFDANCLDAYHRTLDHILISNWETYLMAEARIDVFRKMLEADPNNTTVRFGLANELLKLERFEEATIELQNYLNQSDDQGNAYGKLAQALERLGRIDEARQAYQQGIAAANRHGHPGMAQDFEMALADLP